MKVAFMLVATAWLAGADDDKPAAAPAPQAKPAVVAPAPNWSGGAGYGGGYGSGWNGGCQSSCDTCCDDGCGRHGLLSRFRGLFRRHKSDCCETSCCDSGSGHGHGNWSGGWSGGCCQTASCCDSCDDGCGGHRLFGRLRGLFSRRHKNDCCDDCGQSSCCGNGYGSYGGGAYGPGGPGVPKAGEPIPAPKEPAKAMPSGAPAKTSQLSPAPRLEPAPAPRLGLNNNGF